MRSLLPFLLTCFCLSVATAQTPSDKKVTTPKSASSTQKATTTTAVKKPVVTKPRPATVAVATSSSAAQPVASTLTFPSTEPENVTTMDAVKRQQMYDELHGVKPQSTSPDMGRRGGRAESGQRNSAGVVSPPNRKASAGLGEAGSYVGVRVGGNYTTLLEQPFGVTINPQYGFHAGLVFQFGRGPVAFQPEINYSQDFFSVGQRTFSTASLVVPLLAKIQFGQPGNTRFFVNLGPYGAYPLNANSNNSQTPVEYGGALGLGVGIPAGSGKLTIEARSYYQLGSSAAGSEFGNVTGKPIIGQLSIGYLFPMGSR